MPCLKCKVSVAFYKCSQCHRAQYCSRTCQRSHWKLHKSVCTKYSTCLKQIASLVDIEDICKNVYDDLSKKTVECNCPLCASLCSFIPGNYSPWQFVLPSESDDEEAKNSKTLKLHTMFNSCIQHYHPVEAKQDTTFFLRPQQVHETKRARLELPADGACIHLGANGCTLNRSDMPLGCTSVYGCKPEQKTYLTGNMVEVAWRTKYGRAVMAAFEIYQTCKGMSVGQDCLFVKESEMYLLGLQLTSILLESDRAGIPLNLLTSFTLLIAKLSGFTAAEKHKVKHFAALTYALEKDHMKQQRSVRK